MLIAAAELQSIFLTELLNLFSKRTILLLQKKITRTADAKGRHHANNRIQDLSGLNFLANKDGF